MCGKPNPEGTEVCEHCGARLIPLESKAGSQDWMERMREESEATEAPSLTEQSPEDSPRPGPEPTDPEPDPEAPLGDLPDDHVSEFEDQGEAPEEAVPEWLQRIRKKQTGELEAQAETSPEDALRPKGGTPEDLPASLGPDSGPDKPIERDPAPQPDPVEETPDWLKDAGEPAAESEGNPPALIGRAQETEGGELDDLGLPDWLGEVQPIEEEQPAAQAPGPGPDLAPATLPTWLEAMRPVDTFRSVVEAEPDDDQAVESVGPLAGLSGVLLAEPVVAMPRTSSVGSMQLDVSERQYAQAELLHKLVNDEEGEARAAPRKRTRLAIFRWGIAAFVLLAVALPIITGLPSFALPSREPQDLRVLFNLVANLPGEEPVLIVFDYEPGYAGELEAVSGAFLDQVMSRGLPLASLSTLPAGSPLAIRAVKGYAERHGYENGQDMVHMGYLSGGPTAVQLFSQRPRAAILKGFALPEQMEGQTIWDSPVLQRVQSLSDFGMVAVISSGAEAARVWVEQAQPLMGSTPLVVVLTAGAEPMIRPYFESPERTVAGILSGLRAATTYELRNGRLGPAQASWNPFGTGMLAAELVLLAGIGYGLLNWWRGRSAA